MGCVTDLTSTAQSAPLFDAKDPDVALIVGVKTSHVVRRANLGKHTNNNS